MDQRRDLFISYHTDSSRWMVEKIASILEEKGISCWYAPRDCEQAWAEAILEAIDKASMFLVIINEQSMNSEQVKNEINAAFSRYSKNQLAIVIFKVDTAQMTAATEYYLGRIHMVNGFEPPFEDRLRELVNRISYTKDHANDKKYLSESAKFKSAVITPALCFVGRDRELAELDAALAEYRKVFVSGMGGVGKSELVRAYLVKNKDKFRSVMHATYTSTLKDLFVNDNAVGISNFFRNPPDESDDSYFRRKIEFIQRNGSFEDVLVIDNFNVTEDSDLEMLMSLPISVIFTSRYTYEDYFNLKLSVITDETDLLTIFRKHYPKDLSKDDLQAVKRIFKLVGNHTLTITILANMMKKQRISPTIMLEKLEERVQYGIETQKDINNMIASVFEMSNVSREEQYILQNLILVPPFGISAETFFDYCKLDSYEVIDELIFKNLVQHDSAKDYIALHPVIERTVTKKLGFDDMICENYILSMIDLLNNAKYIAYQRRESTLEMVDQMMRVIPRTSRHYVPFYLAASKTYHAFAKHRLTVEKIEALNCDEVPMEARVEAVTDIADAYRCMEMPEQLLEKAREAMALCQKLDPASSKTKKLKSEILGRFGWYHYQTRNYPECLRYFREQLQMVLVTEDETVERIGWAYFNVALAQNYCNAHSDAIEYFEKALEQFRIIEMDFAIANTYDSISECYFLLENYEKSLEYLFKALPLFEELLGQMHNDTAKTKHLIARNYYRLGDMEKANQFQNEAISCIQQLGYHDIAQHWNEQFSR